MQNRIVNDDELISRLQRGDEWIFQLLVRRFREKVFSTAFGITLDVNQSREIVKEVFLSVNDRAGNLKGEIPLSSWLYRLTVKRCFHWKRRWDRKLKWRSVSLGENKILFSDNSEGDPGDSKNNIDPDQRLKMVESAMKMLPDQVRVVYVLREATKLSYKEIAQVIGIRVGVARTRMFYARKRLQLILQSSGEA